MFYESKRGLSAVVAMSFWSDVAIVADSGDGEGALVSIEFRRGPLGGSGGGMYPELLLLDGLGEGELYGGRLPGATRSGTTTTPLLNADDPELGGICEALWRPIVPPGAGACMFISGIESMLGIMGL